MTKPSSSPAFVKAFIPGLIVGLVSGSLLTAFILPLLSLGPSIEFRAPDPKALSKPAPRDGPSPQPAPPEPAPEPAPPQAQPEPAPASPGEPPR